MTPLQKTFLAAALAAAIGGAIYEARQAALLHAQVNRLQQRPEWQVEDPQKAVMENLHKELEALEARTNELSVAVARANADKARLEAERDQAKRSATLYQELVEQGTSKEADPTNAYPSPRHVWAAFGRMGRLAALSKQDDSKLSPEERSALDAAKTKAIEDLPNLVKAAKFYDAARSSQPDLNWDDTVDEVACLLYGALNLDEQQFGQVFGVMQQIAQQAKQAGFSKSTAGAETTQALNQVMDQFKTQTQALLTPEQAGIFQEVVTHFQVEPGKFGFNFSFSN